MQLKSIRHIFLLTLILGGAFRAWSQEEGLIQRPYGWQAYVSHKNIIEISGLGDSIYAATEGGLIWWNTRDETSHEITRVDGLSAMDPTALLADPLTRRVFIGFKSGEINYLDAAGQLHYITDISRNEQYSTKRINRLYANEGLLYIATDFGLVVYDIYARETRYAVTKVASNTTGSPISAVTIAQGRLWVAMKDLGLWSADTALDNLTLPGVWRSESGQNGLPTGNSTFLCANGDLVFAQVEDTVFQLTAPGPWVRSNLPLGNYNYLNASGGYVYGTYVSSFSAVLYPDSSIFLFNSEGTIKCNYAHNDQEAFFGDKFGGLQRHRKNIGLDGVGPAGPRNNLVVDLDAYKGQLYIAPKGRVGSSGRAYDKSGIPFFDFHDGGWRISDHRNGALSMGDVYQDFYRVAIDTATGRCMVGSWGEGLVEMLDGQVVRTYSSTNSGLAWGTNGHMVSGLAWDQTGNLWVSQGLNNTDLQMLSPDGQWYSYASPYSLLAFGLIVDELGNKWIINNGAGIVVFNDNYTPEIYGDDKWMEINTSYGKGSLPNNTVNCIAQDHDLQIWIGTSEGVTIIYDPTLLWTTDFQDAACPLIEGYCLFRDQQVNDIAVDGYNRKWIATENGAFLVNLDGTEVLQHFTAANSPLLDDVVSAISIDAWTGEVFFGTAKGTVSYIGDAIEGRPNADALYAYPNPARVAQAEPVMIKGMKRSSTVKITNAAGRLVRELESLGGEVPWDLRDSYGNLVTPGVYLAMVADADGQGAGITKIVILEQPN